MKLRPLLFVCAAASLANLAVGVCPTLSNTNTTEFQGTGSCENKSNGDQCTFACIYGHDTLSGDSTRECQDDDTWTGAPLVCTPKSCKNLGVNADIREDIQNYAQCQDKVHGDVCTHECLLGTMPRNNQGDETRYCENGSWTGRRLRGCDKAVLCPTLNQPLNAITSGGSRCNQYGHDDVCDIFSCPPGFVAGGDTSRTCFDGEWTGQPLTCTEAASENCPAVTAIPNAIPQTCTGTYDDTCTYTCATGYQAVGDLTLVCVGAIGATPSWIQQDLASAFECAPKPCPTLAAPTNAGPPASCAGAVQGDSCQFNCRSGFSLTPADARTCDDGEWTGAPQICDPQLCDNLSVPQNGVGTPCIGAAEGETCTFSCQPGFNLGGDATRTCTAGQWSGAVAVCISLGQQYAFTASDWSECSAACGGGSQTRTVECRDVWAGNVLTDIANCADQHEVDDVQSCNDDACPEAFWKTGEWGVCSVSCGGGERHRAVRCVVSTEEIPVDDIECAELEKPPSTDSVLCNDVPCQPGTYQWVRGKPTFCNAVCGGGTQDRTVVCRDANGSPADESLCPQPKPATQLSCATHECAPVTTWNLCGWSTCTAECGGAGAGGGLMIGIKTRAVDCVTQQTRVKVPDSLCQTFATKPPSREEGCAPDDCNDFNWMTTTWSGCQEDPADPTKFARFRTYHCHAADMSNAQNEECPQERVPIDKEECFPGGCPEDRKALGAGLAVAPACLMALATTATAFLSL